MCAAHSHSLSKIKLCDASSHLSCELFYWLLSFKLDLLFGVHINNMHILMFQDILLFFGWWLEHLLLAGKKVFWVQKGCQTLQIIVFFLFCIRFTGLDELAEFNWNQSTMTVGKWKLFCVFYPQPAHLV